MKTAIFPTIVARLQAVGLRTCGAFAIDPKQHPGDSDLPLEEGTVVLVGQRQSGWHHFAKSPEYADGLPNPLDRYSERMCRQIVEGEGDHDQGDHSRRSRRRTSERPEGRGGHHLGGWVVMPSDGPPFFPFQRWAQRAEPVSPSPIGLLLHPTFGLWHAYRAAIVLPLTLDEVTGTDKKTIDYIKVNGDETPCASCSKPCLSTCPVDAFSENGYDVVACKTYLRDNPNAPCHDHSCLARVACPVGKAHEYTTPHKRFLMKAFVG